MKYKIVVKEFRVLIRLTWLQDVGTEFTLSMEAEAGLFWGEAWTRLVSTIISNLNLSLKPVRSCPKISSRKLTEPAVRGLSNFKWHCLTLNGQSNFVINTPFYLFIS